ncbi:MAG: hypothetical protein K0S60_91 [Evtepia sp.]|jgi:hypothetical protein|nr:hypothetical protein [Evtepia sp.]
MMASIAELLLAFFATVGLLSLIWLLFGHLLAPGPAMQTFYAVIPIDGNAPNLEQTVSHLLWLKGGKLAHFQIVLLDTGLSESGKERVSVLLSREPELILSTPELLPQLIKKDG